MKKLILPAFSAWLLPALGVPGGLITNPAYSAPYFYSAEKDGKTVSLLGTVHAGAALQDLTCSDKVFESLKSADLVFLETEQKMAVSLSMDDQKAIFTGSREEREEALKRGGFSQAEKTLIEDTKTAVLEGVVKPLYLSHQYADEERESPEALSPAARGFLAARGIALQENFAEMAYSIALSAYYEAYYTLPGKMDGQIARIAQEENIQTLALDDRSKIAAAISGAAPLQKPVLEINSGSIEATVQNYSQIVESFKAPISRAAGHYLNGELYTAPDGFVYYLTLAALKILDLLDVEHAGTVMLKSRNELWIKKLLKALEKPDREHVFLAGGAAHFFGYANLLELLEEEGFSIRPADCPEDKRPEAL